MLRGVVHDPTARRMGGVAGHAGLFTTADDLARFCRMLLGQGTLDGLRILSPLTVARMTAPSTPAAEPNVRGLGWDLDSSFSSNRGELFPIGSFGHTGFTGTSMWIDPATSTYVVVLANRVHPEGKGDAVPLRARLATIVAAAAAEPRRPPPTPPRPPKPAARAACRLAPAPASRAAATPVLTGIDVLRAEGFARLAGAQGRRCSPTTPASRRDGTSTIDLLHAAKNLTLVALFSPEHGIRGTLDEKVPSGKDEKTGLPIHSLYGETRRPTAEMLAGIDTIVVDLQDIGVRFYTYASTMGLVLEEAARRGIAVVVLDRPNPIDGWRIEGPTAPTRPCSASPATCAMPIRHGLTIGELAQLFNGERKIGAKLTVVRMPRLAPRLVVRRHRPAVDQPVAEHAQPDAGDALPRHRRHRVQPTSRSGAAPTRRSSRSARRGSTACALAAALNARDIPGVRVLSGPLHADVERLRRPGLRRRVRSSSPTARRCARRGSASRSRRRWRASIRRESTSSSPTIGWSAREATTARILGRRGSGRDRASWAADEARWRLLRAKYLIYPDDRTVRDDSGVVPDRVRHEITGSCIGSGRAPSPATRAAGRRSR